MEYQAQHETQYETPDMAVTPSEMPAVNVVALERIVGLSFMFSSPQDIQAAVAGLDDENRRKVLSLESQAEEQAALTDSKAATARQKSYQADHAVAIDRMAERYPHLFEKVDDPVELGDLGDSAGYGQSSDSVG